MTRPIGVDRAAVITPDDVRAAAQRLAGRVHRTPVLTSRTLDALSGAQLFLKAENLQRAGSFKVRGAFHAVSRLDEAQRQAGVVAFSSGNHAQAVALAGAEFGVPSTILMPSDAPELKKAATRGYGAQVIEFDRYTQDREQLAREIVDRTGATLIPPFDHPDVMAGQGTAALELIEEVGEVDVLIAPVGGGGLLSGCATIARDLLPGVRVLGVEPEVGDDARRSLEAGRIVTIGVPRTVADGAQTTALGALTFPVIQRHVEQVLTVSDPQVVVTARLLLERLKILVEPTGALGVAAVLHAAEGSGIDLTGRRVGVILSGGNTDLTRLARLCADHAGWARWRGLVPGVTPGHEKRPVTRAFLG